MWLLVAQISIKAGWWDASLALWHFSQSSTHCILALYNKYSLAISRTSLLQCPHFRSSPSKLFCKKIVLKNFAKFIDVPFGTRASCEFCNVFLQNTSSGCFWHLLQLIFSILWWSKRLHFDMYSPQNNNFLH